MRHARFNSIGLVAMFLCLAVPALSWAQTTVTIANSPHNLNNIPGITLPQSQICLPCHTPHNAPFNGGDLLWNHNVNMNNSYTLYTQVHSTRFGSTSSANPVLDSQSRLCLSCHDGAIAVDAYGGAAGTTVMSAIADSNGVVGGGQLGGTTGLDLSNDHPVGVGYPGLTATTTNGVTTLTFNASVGGGYNDPTQAAFTAGGVGGAAVSLTALPSGLYGVGCGTCHTPHTYTYKFVRMNNTGSALCLRCHNK
jgi:predicted CXXCH cytochrome family protein